MKKENSSYAESYPLSKLMQSFTSIPFKTESGLSQINGIGKFSSAGIVLEFESKLFGIIKGGVKEIRLPLEDLLDVKFRKGFLKNWARIEIRLKSFAKLSELPSKDGKITLKLQRDDFERAQKAVSDLQKNLSEQQDSLPPTHTPVSRLFDEDEAETKELKREN
jgi:hypothetical protein